MKLEEELIIVQYGQGVLSEEELLHRFAQLDEMEQCYKFNELMHLLGQLEPAVNENSGNADAPGEPDASFTSSKIYSKKHKFGRRISMPGDKLDESYKSLLGQFKRDFQQQYALEKESPSSWWYWDLSKSEVVQSILTSHRTLVEEVYNNPSFRGEFASIAKLCYDDRMAKKALAEEPESEMDSRFHFISYDEMIEASLKSFYHKFNRPIFLLSNSLRKALIKQYNLNVDQANEVLWDIVERHLREKYNDELSLPIR